MRYILEVQCERCCVPFPGRQTLTLCDGRLGWLPISICRQSSPLEKANVLSRSIYCTLMHQGELDNGNYKFQQVIQCCLISKSQAVFLKSAYKRPKLTVNGINHVQSFYWLVKCKHPCMPLAAHIASEQGHISPSSHTVWHLFTFSPHFVNA